VRSACLEGAVGGEREGPRALRWPQGRRPRWRSAASRGLNGRGSDARGRGRPGRKRHPLSGRPQTRQSTPPPRGPERTCRACCGAANGHDGDPSEARVRGRRRSRPRRGVRRGGNRDDECAGASPRSTAGRDHARRIGAPSAADRQAVVVEPRAERSPPQPPSPAPGRRRCGLRIFQSSGASVRGEVERRRSRSV